MSFRFRLTASDGAARAGEMTTAHGLVHTPAFMPVGTQAAVKGVHHDDVRAAGTELLLGNTYHLMLRPGAERIAALGGLQAFTTWNGPMLTDSGGFQVMSLATLRKLSEQGVTFRSHIDGASVELTVERAIEIQRLLGSDIAMQLDECVRLPAERDDSTPFSFLPVRNPSPLSPPRAQGKLASQVFGELSLRPPDSWIRSTNERDRLVHDLSSGYYIPAANLSRRHFPSDMGWPGRNWMGHSFRSFSRENSFLFFHPRIPA